MQPGAPPDLSTVWRDDQWLAFYPLNRATALDYFANSVFWDERARPQQGADAGQPPQLEFVLQECQEPHLYVVLRQQRAGPSGGAATALALYYILDGSIYQAPTLHDVLSSRIERCAFQLQAALRTMQADLDPLAQGEAEQAAALTSLARVPEKRLTEAEKERMKTADRVLTAVLKQYGVPEGPALLPGAPQPAASLPGTESVQGQ